MDETRRKNCEAVCKEYDKLTAAIELGRAAIKKLEHYGPERQDVCPVSHIEFRGRSFKSEKGNHFTIRHLDLGEHLLTDYYFADTLRLKLLCRVEVLERQREALEC